MARYIKVEANSAGQRIDNFLIKTLKGVPKSRIYKALRKGEVRVNKGRVKATVKVNVGDEVRLPPLHTLEPKVPCQVDKPAKARLEAAIVFEGDDFLVVNKPAGMPVHGGTQLSYGLIDLLRAVKSDQRYLELVHRLDRATSGCVLVAKSRKALLALQDLMRERKIDKRYSAIAFGRMMNKKKLIDYKLLKVENKSGKRMVLVSKNGKVSQTVARRARQGEQLCAVDCTLLTGRTHQIRVHLAKEGLPIVGDERYGDFSLNHQVAKKGVSRMLLHARELAFIYAGKPFHFQAPLPKEFDSVWALDGDLQV